MMHFKSAVALCALCFFTSAWSAGLNRSQIVNCIKLYKNPNNLDLNHIIPDVMRRDYGIENPRSIFSYDPNEPYYTHFTDFFLVIAYKGIIDNFEVPTLMPIEIELYLKTFNKHIERLGVHGYLEDKVLSDVFEDLNINGEEKTKAEQLVNDKGFGFCCAVEFLLIMIDVLPQGNGLNQAQIEDFVELIELYNTESGSIHSLAIEKIFTELGVAPDSFKELMLFESNRPAAIEWMELIIIKAERSKTVDENEIVLSTQEVRTLVSLFKTFDTDHDGLLSDDEAKQFLEGLLTNNPQDSKNGILSKIFSIFSFLKKKVNVAEILLICIKNKKNVQ